jgi:hypothetical protein
MLMQACFSTTLFLAWLLDYSRAKPESPEGLLA